MAEAAPNEVESLFENVLFSNSTDPKTIQNNMDKFLEEIEKLSVYAGERKIWTKDDIEQTFAALPEVSRFALLNAIAEKKLGLKTLPT